MYDKAAAGAGIAYVKAAVLMGTIAIVKIGLVAMIATDAGQVQMLD